MNEAAPRAQAYHYKARDKAGSRKSGVINATSEREAIATLRRDGIYPISIDTVANVAKTDDRAMAQADGSQPLRAGEFARMIQAIARLVGRSVTLERALGILARGDQKPIAAMAAYLRNGLREGRAFSDLLRDTTSGREPSTVALVQGGESAGALPDALNAAAEILEARVALGQRLLTGMLYPVILFTVSLASLGLILIAIIPQFRPLIAEREASIPFLGRAVFGLSAFAEAFWPFVLLGLALLVLVGVWLRAKGRLAPVLSAASRRLPGLGGIVKLNRTVLALRILGTLVVRRVPLSRAMKVVVDSPLDPALNSGLMTATQAVEAGASLSAALEAESLVPGEVIELVRIGEETGDLGPMLLRAAEDLDANAQRRMQRFLVIFEPVLIVTVGLIIGVSLYALFNAILSVNTLAF
ncbi:MAG: type II secretion system F family protein [Pseudomonadota bacterium]